jgi:hypothetical protein
MSTSLTNPLVALSVKASLASGSAPAPVGSLVNHAPNFSLGAGNTAGNIDRCYSASFAITTGTPLTINVASALDPLGNALGIVHVSSVLVENDSTTAGQDFTIGSGTNPVLGSRVGIAQANGGVDFSCNPSPGFLVTSGSADTLTITVAAGTAVPGKITILGRSA